MRIEYHLSESAKAGLVPPAELCVIDFDNQYHYIRQHWGDRKINIHSLVRYLRDKGFHHFIGVSRVFGDMKQVARFDKLLEALKFSRVYLIDAPRNSNCSTLVLNLLDEYDGNTAITNDPVLEWLGIDCMSFGENLPTSLITPIPAESTLEVTHELE